MLVLNVGLAFSPVIVIVIGPPSLPVEVSVCVTADGRLVVVCPRSLVVVITCVVENVVENVDLREAVRENPVK